MLSILQSEKERVENLMISAIFLKNHVFEKNGANWLKMDPILRSKIKAILMKNLGELNRFFIFFCSLFIFISKENNVIQVQKSTSIVASMIYLNGEWKELIPFLVSNIINGSNVNLKKMSFHVLSEILENQVK